MGGRGGSEDRLGKGGREWREWKTKRMKKRRRKPERSCVYIEQDDRFVLSLSLTHEANYVECYHTDL